MYSLKDVPEVNIDQKYRTVIEYLNNFSTTELEIAATVKFFENSGLTLDQAERETREMKPTKAIDAVLAKSRRVLQYVEEAGNIRNAGSASP